MEAQEQERAWIARELHDDLAQRSVALAMQLHTVAQQIPGGTTRHARIQDLGAQAADLARDIQTIAHQMHSAKLDLLGLASAAANLCEELSKQQELQIAFRDDGLPERLPKEIALVLFRVLQEALTNAVKHSGARHVTVTLRASADAIQLEVVDDGIGFEQTAVTRVHGLGLVSMRERLHLVNGEISVDSRPGAGSRVRARVPLSNVRRRSTDWSVSCPEIT